MDGYYGTILAVAAIRGVKNIVLLLLNRGADIHKVGGYYGTVLAAAVASARPYEKKDIVLLLVNRGADINAMGGYYGTALATAIAILSLYENEDMVLLLLGLGADTNAMGGHYGTALTTATATVAAESIIVSLLLNGGANINAVDGHYGTALTVAASRGMQGIVLLLLDRGADINAMGGYYATALAAAAAADSPHRKKDIVLLLLDRGANINATGGYYGTALAAAAAAVESHEKKDIISLLLGRGADINAKGGYYGTVLATAIAMATPYENEDILLLLLNLGADINAMGGHYGTALATAASREKIDIVLLLLRRGANLDLLLPRSPFSIPYAWPFTFSNESLRSHIIPSNANPVEILPIIFRAGGNIAPAQANVACQSLNEQVLCYSLAALVGLHEYTVTANKQWIQHDVKYFISCNLDFGLAYAAARVAWKHFNEHSADPSVIPIQRRQWHRNVQLLDEQQSKAIDSSSEQELIISPYSVMPRRIWDLRSNRVVDLRMLHVSQAAIETKPTFWAVSHSWTSDMSPVWTRINQYQWPVPLPKDITLDHVRSELLGLGAEYVWIDVVCLRQQVSTDDLERLRLLEEWKLDILAIDNIVYDLEQLRREEWKLDVPTIGNIYRTATNIVRYFNGLGVPFSNSGWDDSRHWLHRAWTLQEIADEKTTINGGIPHALGHVFLNSLGEFSGKVVKLRSAIRPVIQLAAQVDSEDGCEVYELMREMIKRHASQPLDKLSGLFYLLGTTKLPCYDDKMTSEDIWRQCFHLLPLKRKAEILFDFPYRGTDDHWFPTWAQMLSWPVRDPECDHIRLSDLQLQDSLDLDQWEMSFSVSNLWIIPCAVLLKTSNPGEYRVRVGINNRSDFYFYLPYLSQEPIDLGEPEFALAIADLGHAYNWVVCRVIESPAKVAEFYVLKKVGVMRTDSCSQLFVSGLLERKDCRFI